MVISYDKRKAEIIQQQIVIHILSTTCPNSYPQLIHKLPTKLSTDLSTGYPQANFPAFPDINLYLYIYMQW